MSADQFDAPPPPYEDAASAIARQPPFPRPDQIQTHYITIESGTASPSLPFPDPAELWLGRDISRQDWSTFVANLTAALEADEQENKQQSKGQGNGKGRVAEIVARWNSGFFEPRGLKIVLNDEGASAGSSGSGSSRFQFGPDKFGVKIGSGIFGLDLSKKSNPEK
ncbi:uncharacterized protein CTRU02_201149 [Colletotrichum truncatum]|uniref:Uncharacterized protein n=1 Tax=Colletotrichum truncatum TaxID=5467 RepID=A0ACC3ZH25_COLTU|nr:uncharacterized protein CTRU02_07934 [Colletotrichum truncatum]KAF6790414.1 hypothetical protein CTRU02_07934 [Colletotrichum truncatum]